MTFNASVVRRSFSPVLRIYHLRVNTAYRRAEHYITCGPTTCVHTLHRYRLLPEVATYPSQQAMATLLHPHLFIDGYIAYMLSPPVAELYFSHLLKRPLDRQTVVSQDETCYMLSFRLRSHPAILDYCASNNLCRGTIVPQRLWTPRSSTDRSQYVENATLQTPVFFHNGSILGISVAHAVEGDLGGLLRRNDAAELGGKASTHIRIAVRFTLLALATVLLDGSSVARL